MRTAAAARQRWNQTFDRRATVTIKLAQVNLTNLPACGEIEA
jgi:hypothetical protein